MYEDEQANVQVYDSYFQEEVGKVWKVGGLQDWESEGTESGGSDDEVKEGVLGLRRVSRSAARRMVTARVLIVL